MLDRFSNVNQLAASVGQSIVDSGSLSGFSTVAHRFVQFGSRAITVTRPGQPDVQLALNVAAPSAAPTLREASAAVIASSVATIAGLPGHVDLSQLHQLGSQLTSATLTPTAQGYVAFHAAAGDVGYAVHVAPPQPSPSAPASPPEFDSRLLGPGDVFGTLLLRPGTYRLTNTANGTAGTIVVPYPVSTGKPYQPPGPLAVAVNANGFSPSQINLQPIQALAFQINTPARITMTLTTPDDGPGPAARPIAPTPP